MSCTSKTSYKLCGKKSCSHCFNRSLASVDLEKVNLVYLGDIPALKICKKSTKVQTFMHTVCGHILQFNPGNIKSENSLCCKFCYKSETLCEKIDCDFCYNKSFASVDLTLHHLELLNGVPREISRRSPKKIDFKCLKCKHNISITPYNLFLSALKGNNSCVYCASQNLCDDLNCVSCFEKSLASTKYKDCFLEEENGISVRKVFKKENKKRWLKCKNCKHKIFQLVSTLTDERKNGCEFCGNKNLCGDKECKQCYENSLQSFLDKENIILVSDVNPLKVRKFMNDKLIFKCKKNHIFETLVSNLVGRNGGCARCCNKTEEIFHNFLIEEKISFIHQKTFQDSLYRFDFLLEDYNLVIEIDGDQHFHQVSNWNSPEKNLENDTNKTLFLLNQNISLIRITQISIYKDIRNWKKLILEYIKLYEEKTVIFISDNVEIYDRHVESLKDVEGLNLIRDTMKLKKIVFKSV